MASLHIPMDILELETRNDTSAETHLSLPYCLQDMYCVMAGLANSSMSLDFEDISKRNMSHALNLKANVLHSLAGQ